MYSHLIERKNSETFKTQVKPYLNKGEHYYIIYLLDEDRITLVMKVGYAYRCTEEELYADINKWAEEEIEGFGDFYIVEKELLEDGTPHAVASWVY